MNGDNNAVDNPILSKLRHIAEDFIKEDQHKDLMSLLQECIDTLANYHDECKRISNAVNEQTELISLYESAYIYYQIVHGLTSQVIPLTPQFIKAKNASHTGKDRSTHDRQLLEIYHTIVKELSKETNRIDQIKSFLKSQYRISKPTGSGLTISELETLLNHQDGNSVLLIDVRPRLEFNTLHVKASNIICLEPISFKSNYTDFKIEKTSLIPSPKHEIALFKARKEFEFIVIYTRSASNDADFNSKQMRTLVNILLASFNEANFNNTLVYYLDDTLENWASKTSLVVNESSIEDRGTVRKSRTTINSDFASVASGEALGRSIKNRMPTSRLPPLPAKRIEERGKYTESNPLHVDSTNSSIVHDNSDLGVSNLKYPEPKSILSPVVTSTKTILKIPSHVIPINGISNLHHNHHANNNYRFMQEHVNQANGNRKTGSDKGLDSKRQDSNADFTRLPNEGSTKNLAAAEIVKSKSPSPNLPHLPTRSIKFSKSATGLASGKVGHSMLNFAIGMENMGNSCYLNCIVQCLLGTPELVQIFLDKSYEKHINLKSRLGSKGVLAQNFAILVKTMYDTSQKSAHDNVGNLAVKPLTFKKACGHVNHLFMGNTQQDCQEFCQFLLDGLHEDLNQCGENPPLKELSTEAEIMREQLSLRVASAIEWERFLTTDFSVIVDLFQGQYASRLQCRVCSRSSTTYQTFSILSVPIPCGKSCNLLDCFREFTKLEYLDKDERWFCPDCQKKQPSTKQLIITRLPRKLIIHLKRFDNMMNKNNIFVNYPSVLDITSFWADDYDGKLPPGITKELPARGQVPPFNYKLYSVAVHVGSLYGGHYTAYVDKGSRNGWEYFDDASIRKIKMQNEFITPNAYVLMYSRIYNA